MPQPCTTVMLYMAKLLTVMTGRGAPAGQQADAGGEVQVAGCGGGFEGLVRAWPKMVGTPTAMVAWASSRRSSRSSPGHVGAGEDLVGADHQGGEWQRPGVGVEHRGDQEDFVAGGEAEDVGEMQPVMACRVIERCE